MDLDYTTIGLASAAIIGLVLLYYARFFHNISATIKDIQEYGWAEHCLRVQRYMKHQEAEDNLAAKYTKKGEIKMVKALKKRK